MKLLATALATVNAFVQSQNECYAPNVDIDGNYFRTNIVETIKAVYSPQECQGHCQKWAKRGCVAFVYEEAKSKCTLVKDIGEIEYDEDSSLKVMGQVNGCLPCFRLGWDYVNDASRSNLQGKGYIASVPDVYSCAKICSYVEDCEFVSYRKPNKKCFLKKSGADHGIEFDDDYDTATSGCRAENCVKRNTEYANGYITRYDIIGRMVNSYIPGVKSPADCQQICRQTTDCTNFTWQEGDYCYLVSTNYWLEYGSDKISGSRDCMQQ